MRRRAEAELAARRPVPADRSEADRVRLVHELQVHQVELEMQNEELTATRARAEALPAQVTARRRADGVRAARAPGRHRPPVRPLGRGVFGLLEPGRPSVARGAGRRRRHVPPGRRPGRDSRPSSPARSPPTHPSRSGWTVTRPGRPRAVRPRRVRARPTGAAAARWGGPLGAARGRAAAHRVGGPGTACCSTPVRRSMGHRRRRRRSSPSTTRWWPTTAGRARSCSRCRSRPRRGRGARAGPAAEGARTSGGAEDQLASSTPTGRHRGRDGGPHPSDHAGRRTGGPRARGGRDGRGGGLRGGSSRCRAPSNRVSPSILVTDRSGALEFVNPQFTRATGYTAAEVLGKNPRLLKSGTHDDAFYREALADRGRRVGAGRAPSQNRRQRTARSTGSRRRSRPCTTATAGSRTSSRWRRTSRPVGCSRTSSGRRRRWRPSASWRAAWPTTSTTS